MFIITRANREYFRNHQNHIVNGDLIQTVAWVSDKNKAAKFETFESAKMTVDALQYDYNNLQIVTDK